MNIIVENGLLKQGLHQVNNRLHIGKTNQANAGTLTADWAGFPMVIM